MGALGSDRRRLSRPGVLGLRDLREPLSAQRKLQLAVEIYIAYCRVRWWLTRHEVREVVGRLRAKGPADTAVARCGEDDLRDVHLAGLRLGRAVILSLRLLPTDSRCLMRSLVLIGLLARRGITSSLIIAVKAEPEFAAHAWVEHGGKPLLPPGDTSLGRLTEL